MEATETTNPESGDCECKSLSTGELHSSSSTQTRSKSSSTLKSFLQRANFSLDFNLNSTSPQSKQIPAPQISPVKTKPEAVASSPASDEERAVKQRRLTSTSLLGQETPSDCTPLKVSSIKEQGFPVHLVARTLCSSSLNPNTKDIEMGRPGLNESRWAHAGGSSDPYSGVSVAARNPTVSFFTTPTQHQVTRTTNLPLHIHAKEDMLPLGRGETPSSRLAELKARREASRKPSNNTGTTEGDTDPQEQTRIAQEGAAVETESERLTQGKAQSDHLNTELLTKEKSVAEYRIKTQSDLNIVLAKIKQLEEQERVRINDHNEQVMNAKTELADAQAFLALVESDKAEANKLVEVETRLDNLRKKLDDAQGGLDEARTLVDEFEKALADLDTASSNALDQHKQALSGLVKGKVRLEHSLSHPHEYREDVTALSASVTTMAKTLGVETPIATEEPPWSTASALKIEPTAPVKQIAFETPTIHSKGKGLPTFAAWLEKKPGPRSPVRSVRLENIPSTNPHHGNISRLVFHGAIHSFNYGPGNKWAEFTFLKAEDCQKYLEATRNGIPWPEEPGRIIVPRPCEPESGDLEQFQIMIQKGLTRCVRIVGIDPEWTPIALKRIAEQSGRRIERLVNGHDSKARRICDFRFCKVVDAVAFKSQMEKDEKFVKCQISFTVDPCTTDSVHNSVIVKTTTV